MPVMSPIDPQFGESGPRPEIPPLPSLQRALAQTDPTASATAGGPSEALTAWILGLRWVAVVALFCVLILATSVWERIPPAESLRLWVLWGTLAIFAIALSAAGARRLATPRALLLQIGGDVVLLGALLHTAGGLHNPFAAIFAFHAIIAAVVLDRRRALQVVAGISGFVLALTAVEATGLLPPGCLLEGSGTCFAPDPLLLTGVGASVTLLVACCGWIVVPLVEQLRRERDHLRTVYGKLVERIEEARAAQRSLQSEQEKLRAIVDCMTDAVIFASPDGRVLLHNRTGAALLGAYPGADHDLRVCHDASTWAALMAKLTDPGPNEHHPVLHINGRTYEATYARVDLGGELLGAVMLARDITERLREEAGRVERERMATVGKLAAALAHEINNPLGAIALIADHARRKAGRDSAIARHLDTILRNAELCRKIVRELLDYARQRPPDVRRFAAAELREAILHTLSPYCRRRGIDLEIHVEPEDTVVHGDPVQLRQALVNLGLNAVEAMERGGKLVLRVRRDTGGIRMEVQDTGPGIPEAQEEEIFTEFFTTKPEGTGLGLAVARDIARAHGGRLYLDRSYQAGARFVIELPDFGEQRRGEERVA